MGGYKYIHWNSRLARFFLKRQYEAITIGKHIFVKEPEIIYDTDVKSDLIEHEMCHVEQYKKYGVIRFIVKYLYYHVRFGYSDNPLEIECRK